MVFNIDESVCGQSLPPWRSYNDVPSAGEQLLGVVIAVLPAGVGYEPYGCVGRGYDVGDGISGLADFCIFPNADNTIIVHLLAFFCIWDFKEILIDSLNNNAPCVMYGDVYFGYFVIGGAQ